MFGSIVNTHIFFFGLIEYTQDNRIIFSDIYIYVNKQSWLYHDMISIDLCSSWSKQENEKLKRKDFLAFLFKKV